MIRHSMKTLALAGLTIVGAAATAQAQQFDFGTDSLLASPGDVLSIPITLRGASDPVAGVNYTVRVSAADNSAVMLSAATSSANPSLSGFTYVDNNALARTGVTSGQITGNVQEFRGVLYSASGTPATFDANSEVTVATLMIPISTGATAGAYNIELVSAIDNNTGLLGVSNANGDSLVPAGLDRPTGALATIFVQEKTDFTSDGGNPAFSFLPILPLDNPDARPEGAAIMGTGLQITAVGDECFGFWGTDLTNPWASPDAGMLYVVDWTVNSNVDGTAVLPNRMRINTGDSLYARNQLVQDNADGDGISVVSGTAGKTFRMLFEVPQSSTNGVGLDGVSLSFDMFRFGGPSQLNSSLNLVDVRETLINPANLGIGNQIYTETFGPAGSSNWISAEGLFPEIGATLGGLTVSHVTEENGLGMVAGGLQDAEGNFSLGFWQTRDDQFSMTADSTKLYKLDARLFGSELNPRFNPTTRFRMVTLNSEYVEMQVIAPYTDLEGLDTDLKRPDLDGEDYSIWFSTPPSIDGQPLRIIMDVFHVSGDPSSANATIWLKSLTVTEYNSPLGPLSN